MMKTLFFTFLTLVVTMCYSTNARINENSLSNHNQQHQQQQHYVTVSSNIPPLEDTIELARLSSLMYSFYRQNSQDCSAFPSEDNDKDNNTNTSFHCHMYEKDDQDTQVLIVSRTTRNNKEQDQNDHDHEKDYIAIVYAGTDDFRNTLTDTDIRTKFFGPQVPHYNNATNSTFVFPSQEEDIRVHAGFNNAVFKNDLFFRIYDIVQQFKVHHPHGRILTTGHSLGAADSILTAVGLKLQPLFKDEMIHSINFGCPKTGNSNWKTLVNNIDNLGIWRVVNGLDLVPRLPGIRFHHVGHTIQLDKRSVRGFWLHEGDIELGYAGIPFGWNTMPYILAPVAAYEHLISHYTSYLNKKSAQNPMQYYFQTFESIDRDSDGSNQNDDDDDDELDDILNFPDDDLFWTQYSNHIEFERQYAEQYMQIFEVEKQGYSVPFSDEIPKVSLTYNSRLRPVETSII